MKIEILKLEKILDLIRKRPETISISRLPLLTQAYPEYLICYQIVKPDSNSDDSSGASDCVNPRNEKKDDQDDQFLSQMWVGKVARHQQETNKINLVQEVLNVRMLQLKLFPSKKSGEIFPAYNLPSV